MAFVTSTALTSSVRGSSASSLRPDATTALRTNSTSSSSSTVRMGYGDYSYLTDKTKGHVNQYYVDKFRRVSDFARGPPASDAEALVGRNMKGGVLIPSQGIPQLVNTPEIPIFTDVTPDPRIAESEGQCYEWDLKYENPAFAPNTYADLDDEEVSSAAMAQYRDSVSSERTASLSAMDFGAVQRVNRLKTGTMEESYLLTLDGQLDVEYAKLQKIASIPTFTPTGAPQTEIPGFPYLNAVGAMDFIDKPGDSYTFWKADTPAEPMYKKPSGSGTPELPYNTAPSVPAIIEGQEARDIVPKS